MSAQTEHQTRRSALAAAKKAFWNHPVDFENCASQEQAKTSSSEIVATLANVVLGSSSGARPPRRDSAHELRSISKAARVILSSVEDGTLTESEAESVLRMLSEHFAARRLNTAIEKLFHHSPGEWFMSAAKRRKEFSW